ncbi:MAG: TIGR03943 family protein [Cyanobacteria bacterium P01_H01_bin.119]
MPAGFKFRPAYLEILALLAWGTVFLHYWFSKQIKLLIHPRFFGVVVITGIVLIALGIVRAIAVSQSRAAPQIQHVTVLPGKWSSALLLAIAVTAVIVPIQPLGSQAALQEGYTMTGLPPTRIRATQFTGGASAEERTLSEWIRTLAAYPEPDSYQGKPVKVSGFVVYPPDLSESAFMITRFVIRHCAIDAVPVGLPVLLEGDRSDHPQDSWPQDSWPQDSWQEISGTLTVWERNGVREVAIAPEEISAIPEPDAPYEY